mmetsp:Transcript_51862/g.168587  ORF Transcript_51862/g.168587 Transcript_51862/m.168587 type:complete len:247 (-) Transcript_51862:2205-2945(-)
MAGPHQDDRRAGSWHRQHQGGVWRRALLSVPRTKTSLHLLDIFLQAATCSNAEHLPRAFEDPTPVCLHRSLQQPHGANHMKESGIQISRLPFVLPKASSLRSPPHNPAGVIHPAVWDIPASCLLGCLVERASFHGPRQNPSGTIPLLVSDDPASRLFCGFPGATAFHGPRQGPPGLLQLPALDISSSHLLCVLPAISSFHNTPQRPAAVIWQSARDIPTSLHLLCACADSPRQTVVGSARPQMADF